MVPEKVLCDDCGSPGTPSSSWSVSSGVAVKQVTLSPTIFDTVAILCHDLTRFSSIIHLWLRSLLGTIDVAMNKYIYVHIYSMYIHNCIENSSPDVFTGSVHLLFTGLSYPGYRSQSRWSSGEQT